MTTGNICNSWLNEVIWQKALPANLIMPVREVHIWRIKISDHLIFLNDFKAWLNAEEIIRTNKYIYERDRNRFIISRGAQRYILGIYLKTQPALLQFKLGDHKKPYVLTPGGINFHYNLSHSGDWILLAVSSQAVGMDIEHIDPTFKFDDILPEHFSSDENDYVKQQHSTQRFITLWTRKEALLKATGQGIGDHLKYTPALNGQHIMHKALSGREDNWQIISFNIPVNYIASIATPATAPQIKFLDIDVIAIPV